MNMNTVHIFHGRRGKAFTSIIKGSKVLLLRLLSNAIPLGLVVVFNAVSQH